MGNYFCGLAVCDVAVRLRRFAKAFCHAGKPDIQEYAPAQNIFTGIFLHAIITVRGAHRDTPCSISCKSGYFPLHYI